MLLLVILPGFVVAAGVVGAFKLFAIAPPPRSAGIAFDVDGAASLGELADQLYLDTLIDAPGAAGQIESSFETRVVVRPAACGEPVEVRGSTSPDSTWWRAVRATRERRDLLVTTRYGAPPVRASVKSPNVQGRFGFSIIGEIESLDVRLGATDVAASVERVVSYGGMGPVTTFVGRIPDRAFDGPLASNEASSDSLDFSFQASWSKRRGFGSCYVRVPALVDVGLFPLAEDSLSEVPPAGEPGPRTGIDVVELSDAVLDRDATDPPARTDEGGIMRDMRTRGAPSDGQRTPS